MKTLITSAVISTIAATSAMSAISISDLTNDQQAAVRMGECYVIQGENIGHNLSYNFHKVNKALRSKGQKFERGSNLDKFIRKSNNDARIALVLGDLDASPKAFDTCYNDLILIAADDYKPNFTK